MTELVAALDVLYTEFEGIRELPGYSYTHKQNASVGKRTTCDEMCGGAGADGVGRVTGIANAFVSCEGRGGSTSGAL